LHDPLSQKRMPTVLLFVSETHSRHTSGGWVQMMTLRICCSASLTSWRAHQTRYCRAAILACLNL
jgi:hypothetical protein